MLKDQSNLSFLFYSLCMKHILYTYQKTVNLTNNDSNDLSADDHSLPVPVHTWTDLKIHMCCYTATHTNTYQLFKFWLSEYFSNKETLSFKTVQLLKFIFFFQPVLWGIFSVKRKVILLLGQVIGKWIISMFNLVEFLIIDLIITVFTLYKHPPLCEREMHCFPHGSVFGDHFSIADCHPIKNIF